MQTPYAIDSTSMAAVAAPPAPPPAGPRPVGPGQEFGRMVVQLERRGQGQEFLAYVFPRLRRPRFRSPLVNERNLALSGDAAWLPLLARVIDRRKPIAFVDSWEPADMVDAVGRAMAAGCPVQWSPGCCAVGIPGVIRRELDLGALAADYQELTARAGRAAGEQIAGELRRFGARAFADCLSFVDVESDGTPSGLARCGLLLGYPIETTAAWIGRILRVDGCWTGKFGVFGEPPDEHTLEVVARFLAGDGGPAEPWLRPYMWPPDPPGQHN